MQEVKLLHFECTISFPVFFFLIGKKEIRNGVNMVVGSSPLNDL